MENIAKIEVPNQVQLWDVQHAERFAHGMEATELRNAPSESAQIFASNLPPASRILEIGCAHGRDARSWAALGHRVYCTDFSQVALDQLAQLAEEQGVRDLLHPILHDISSGVLPETDDLPIDGFFARSALHVDDGTLRQVGHQVNMRLSPHGIILIEGKGINDHKIRRGTQLGNGLVVDPYDNGHLRRAWTIDAMEDLCRENDWGILELKEREEVYENNPISFLRLIARKK